MSVNKFPKRIVRKDVTKQLKTLFNIEKKNKWESYWWGMPEFSMEDATPEQQIIVNFICNNDIKLFAEKLGYKNINKKTKSLWYPHQPQLEGGKYYWRGIPSETKYPIYIPSKGRYDVETTGRLLRQAGAKFHFVVESHEEKLYRKKYGDSVLVLPFKNLGQGSIPARNWIWEHALKNDYAWHWILDDNITRFERLTNNRRLQVIESSAPLRIVEDFIDRYDNLALAGLSHQGFAPDRNIIHPISFNTRIYSCTLIKTDLPYRWRGKYNEDTDLCLRILKDGLGTALFKSFLMDKHSTSRGDGTGGLKGGNTDNVYNTNDYRSKFVDSLIEQHPDCVSKVWKYNRYHHQVDYSKFKKNKISLKEGVIHIPVNNNYDLELFIKEK